MSKNVVTLKWGSEVTQVNWKWYHSVDVYGFLLEFFSNFVPITHRFWDIRLVSIKWPWNGHFRLKLPIFPTPVYLTPRWMGSPWNWVSAPGDKTRMGLPDGRKSFKDRFSRFDTIPTCERHPVSQPATQSRCRSKDRAYVYVALVKNILRAYNV